MQILSTFVWNVTIRVMKRGSSTITLEMVLLICSTCRKHFPAHFPFMTYDRLCNQINTTCGTGTENPSGAHEFFSGIRVTRSLVLCECFVDRCLSIFVQPLCCLSFFDLLILITPLLPSNSSAYVLQIVVCPFVLFLLTIVLSVLLRYTDSDYLHSIIKLFINARGFSFTISYIKHRFINLCSRHVVGIVFVWNVREEYR